MSGKTYLREGVRCTVVERDNVLEVAVVLLFKDAVIVEGVMRELTGTVLVETLLSNARFAPSEEDSGIPEASAFVREIEDPVEIAPSQVLVSFLDGVAVILFSVSLLTTDTCLEDVDSIPTSFKRRFGLPNSH
jgi:hypothetical protein